MKDLIVFGEDWGGLPSSTQHLISHIACDKNQVLWVNSIGLRQPKFNLRDLSRVCKKLSMLARSLGGRNNTLSRSLPSLKNVYVINLVSLPAPKTWWVRRINAYIVQRQVNRYVKRHGLTISHLWASLPTAVDFIGKLNASKTVYYCGDDFSALEGVDHKVVSERERELAEKSDIIFTASKKLLKKFDASKSYCITHGVDVELFSKPKEISINLNKLKKQGKPIAGFYGSLSDWLDVELIYKVAKKRSSWNFVFIGDSVIDLSLLKTLPNIYFLPSVNHRNLPSYSQHWNVSLLPFKLNRQIEACNPLKLKEYLSTGVSVISTFFPALDEFYSLINVVNDENEFCLALDKCEYTKNNSELINAVASESWVEKSKMATQYIEGVSCA